MEKFVDVNLAPSLNQALEKIGYITATPIQQQAIPVALEGKDILGSAQTGTGKTAAFLIPIINNLLNNPSKASKAIILTPTRELARQIAEVAKSMLTFTPYLKSCMLVGGEPIGKQLHILKTKRPRIIIGTPGRVIDHMERGTLRLDTTQYLVLDETDRMLDMGFDEQIADIVSDIPDTRQTLLFSATISKEIAKIAQNYLNNPERISIGHTNTATTTVKQQNISTTGENKYDDLVKALHDNTGSAIIFVKTKINTDKLCYRLNKDKYQAVALHGGLPQRKRDRALKSFRDQKFDILVATDVAARGLDVDHIDLVINYDLPQAPEDYVHRIGRTGRADREGRAISLITAEDKNLWFRIDKFLNPDKYKGRSFGSKSYNSRSRWGNKNSNRNNRGNSYTRSNNMTGTKDSENRKPHHSHRTHDNKYEKNHKGFNTGNKSFNDMHKGHKAKDHAHHLLDKKFNKQAADRKKDLQQEIKNV
jgi:ATP-dependent RNA helicase DeaD